MAMRVRMTFCDKNGRQLRNETWRWMTDMSSDKALLLHQWIGLQYADLFLDTGSVYSVKCAEKAVEEIVINQVSVHQKDLERAPLCLLRDGDVVKVRMAGVVHSNQINIPL